MSVPGIVTVQQHLHEEQRRRYPQASGEFSWLLSGITLATKMIADRVRRAGLTDVLGSAEQSNVQGELVQKLDMFANQALLHCLGSRGNVAIMASEENERPIVDARNLEQGKYIVVFDPLDGSSNIDVNVSVGTIFSILKRDRSQMGRRDPSSEVLQPGKRQVAAGYVVYGSSTMLVYTAGNGVFGFTLDPAVGAYVLSHERITMPERGSIYSTNEANSDSFPDSVRRFLAKARSGGLGRPFSSRYIGSLVADFHRTLLKGGVFLYPQTSLHPEGKLRLLYEANPIALLAEQAGGVASTGAQRVLDVQPKSVHQRTPLLVGSREDMNALLQETGAV